MDRAIVKCDCGATFADLDSWRRLELDQIVRLDEAERLELRKCDCGQLLGLNIDRNGLPLVSASG